VTVDPAVEREFTEFVVARTQGLMRVAYALTGDQHAAEDLLQSALAKAAMRWSHINGDAEPYVRRILYHDHISWWRRRRRRPETSMADLPERADRPDFAGQTNLRLLLWDALRTLPPRQRAVLVLRYLEDRSEREVAEILGCRPGTVASQASRALARLRALVPALTELDARFDPRFHAGEVLR
jgi:RNA polymerase sigma-70 factor (sigma-E family)